MGSDDKRQRIVDAATLLFTRYGFKRTSVELLAREANVAKPTIYAYFDDKAAIFRAVVTSVCDDFLAAAERAFEARGSLEERLTAVLAAKFTRYWELVQSSPHARELIDSQGSLGAEIIQELDRAYLKLLIRALDDARAEIDPKRAGLSSVAAAQLLLRAASGAAYDATSVASHRKHLAELVRVIVAGLRRR